MRMSYLTFLAVISFHAIKSIICTGNEMHMESVLRQIRFMKKEKYPDFEESTPCKIRVARGEVAYLRCMVKNVVNESISWIRNRDLHILTVDDDVYTGDRRFQILVDASANWTLRIDNVQFEDSGNYECQINTQPVSVFPVYLAVFDRRHIKNPIEHFLDYGMDIEEEINPDVVNDEVSVQLPNYLREDSGIVKILEGTEIILKEGAMLNITCEVHVGRSQNRRNFISTLDTSDPLRNLTLIWLHNNQVLSEETCHEGTSIRTKNSSRLIRSRLLIFKVLVNDSGVYICRPLIFNKEAVIKVEVVSGLQLRVPSITLVILLVILLTTLHTFSNNFCYDFL